MISAKKPASESESLVTILRDVTQVFLDETHESRQIKKINDALENDPQKINTRCNKLVRYGVNNHLQFLGARYNYRIRSTLLNCLSFLEIDHTAHGGRLLDCLNTILKYQNAKMSTIAVSAIDTTNTGKHSPIDWVHDKWSQLLFVDSKKNKKNRMMHTNYFELCVVSELAKRFRSGDLFVANSTKYNDYRTQLISWEEYYAGIDEFAEQIGLSKNAGTFIQNIKTEFLAVAEKVDKRFPEDSYVAFERDELVLRRRSSAGPSKRQQQLDNAIKERMPLTNILDLLVETSKWAPLTKFFRPLSGHQSKLSDYEKRIIATLFCYGCNLGPTQAARSIKELSRNKLRFLISRMCAKKTWSLPSNTAPINP